MTEHLWLLISALLVFLMQAGFLCLESGRTRSKNSINVAAKNVSDFVVSAVLFWLFGFGLMFGDSQWGVIGVSHFLFGQESSAYEITFFLFQMMFCGTAATLMSGAVAERTTFNGYLVIAFILSALVYPVTGHWAWAGIFSPYSSGSGWLESMGFVDFAGSTVVHSVGGWVSLVAVLIIGPRHGRFDSGRKMPPGNNLPMSALGTLLIWFGWFGFNGGSTLALDDRVPSILLNTCLSALWGGVVVTVIHYRINKFVDVGMSLNGIIAGLVAITAPCHAVTPAEAAIIGGVSGIVLFYSSAWMEKLQIDDALDVVPAHLFAGAWGTLAVGLFGSAELLGTGLTFWQQIGVQLLGIVVIGAYCFVVSYLAMSVANRFVPLRVSLRDEKRGLNITEHHATTELIDLLDSMEAQQSQGQFTSPVEEEPFTEVGQIANRYNKVISRVNSEIAQRDDAIQRFRESEERKSAILQSAMDCILTIGRQGNIIEFNSAAERIMGCLKSQISGQSFIDNFILPEDRPVIEESLAHGFSTSEGLILNRRNSLSLQRASGQPFPAEISITTAYQTDKDGQEYTFHIRDVSRQAKMQSKLRQLAYSDPLTNLNNRNFLQSQLNRAIETARRESSNVALLFLDLDNFKRVNDTLGHKAGDQLLCEVASRLLAVSRKTDIIARWGGDEFIILLSGDVTELLLAQKAERILDAMRQPLEIQGKLINIPTSIGIVLSAAGQVDAERMLQYADIAMYHVKQRGRDNYQIFHPDMEKKTSRHYRLEQDMRESLGSEDFFVVYQPKVDTQGANVVGFEALMRWQHPQEGVINPDEFIPLAEESDLIVKLGEKAIEASLSLIAGWREQGLEVLPIAVNISSRHLIASDLVKHIEEQLALFGINGNLLEIEITEGALVQDFDYCVSVLTKLKALGIKIAVDDFGTGYSSLNYLKQLPLDILKIDRAFVEGCDAIEENGSICTAIIMLARSLGLTPVAEGVETILQRDFLLERGCRFFQGFYFYKPMSGEEAGRLLAAAKSA